VSVFAEPLAQVRERLPHPGSCRIHYAENSCSCGSQEALAALDLIERHAQEMEKALQQIAAIDTTPPAAARISRAALSAREEAWTHQDRMVLGDGGC
jgi:hypothetical protein